MKTLKQLINCVQSVARDREYNPIFLNPPILDSKYPWYDDLIKYPCLLNDMHDYKFSIDDYDCVMFRTLMGDWCVQVYLPEYHPDIKIIHNIKFQFDEGKTYRLKKIGTSALLRCNGEKDIVPSKLLADFSSGKEYRDYDYAKRLAESLVNLFKRRFKIYDSLLEEVGPTLEELT